jgi:hypothetical protein
MYRLLPESTATPAGSFSVVADGGELQPEVLHVSEVKLGCPNTISGVGGVVCPAASGVLNSNTRLLLESLTYRLPALSAASPCGSHKVVAVGGAFVDEVEPLHP